MAIVILDVTVLDCTIFKFNSPLLPPDHFVDNAGVALDELDDLGRYVLINIGWNWNTVILVPYHFHCYVNCLEEVVLVDAGEDEAAFVEGFGALGAGAYAHCGK